jgi:TAT-translocated FGD2 family F420-dependent dehydrogenase
VNPGNPKMSDRRRLLKSGTLVGLAAMSGALSSGKDFVSANSESIKVPNEASSSRSIGFMLPHEQFDVAQLVELGVAAENAGFDFVATSDHFQPWQNNEGHSGMAWVTMAALGQKTSRIRMGTTVTCPTYRYNPAVVAEGFASLSILYPNRIFLGIGSGEALNEQAATGMWDPWPIRSERLIEATQVIRELWKGSEVKHDGKHYKVEAKLYDPPRGDVPLLMAGNGPKAMRRCGLYADGLVTDPKTWKEHKNEFLSGLKEAGREVQTAPVLVEQYVVVGGKSELDEAVSKWRFGPKAWKPYFNIRDPKEIEARAMREVPAGKVSEGWPVGTDAGAHIKAVEELFQSGATMVNIHTGQSDQMRVIKFYKDEVIPKLRTRAAA